MLRVSNNLINKERFEFSNEINGMAVFPLAELKPAISKINGPQQP
ncbi:hypothetical protein BSU04_16715 [Caballeronia sordidicola]|uniref:Uncharacterized protein n=1 Tax=Caballeronia sordidicola TaxID=196367 RepID=A0A226X230_CABSO|nr:hypothetical protein BSU04_16715 [Caballeronia sordidicola]